MPGWICNRCHFWGEPGTAACPRCGGTMGEVTEAHAAAARAALVTSNRGSLLAGGLLLQLAAVCLAGYLVVSGLHHAQLLGVIGSLSVGFLWSVALTQPLAHTVIVICALAYLDGSVAVASTFVTSKPMLFIGVPLAALATLAVLGVLAVVVVALLSSNSDLGSISLPDLSLGSSRRRRRP